jgi:hypothetical protein
MGPADAEAAQTLKFMAHDLVALHAAALHAWTTAAAAANTAALGAKADLAVHTLAAQRAVVFAAETLVPMLDPSKQHPVGTQLLRADDALLLLVVYLPLLSRRIAAQEQQQEPAACGQLLYAVGLGSSFLPLPRGQSDEGQQQVRTVIPEEIQAALLAIRNVFLVQAANDGAFGVLEQPLTEHLQLPVCIDFAAVWQPLLQVVLQLPLTATAAVAAVASPDGTKGACLEPILALSLSIVHNALDCVGQSLQEATGDVERFKTSLTAVYEGISYTVGPALLGQLAPLALQQLKRSAHEQSRKVSKAAALAAATAAAGAAAAA